MPAVVSPIDIKTKLSTAISFGKTAIDNVSLPKLYYGWHTPALYQPGDAEMDHLANILASSKVSRLYKTLVYEMKIAQARNKLQQAIRECKDTLNKTTGTVKGVLSGAKNKLKSQLDQDYIDYKTLFKSNDIIDFNIKLGIEL